MLSNIAVREMTYPSPGNCRFLAYAVKHGFYETTHKGAGQIRQQRILQEYVRQNEVEILKKVQHSHIVQMLGLYPLPGPVLWPLARCHLETFLEDVEEVRNQLKDYEKSTKTT